MNTPWLAKNWFKLSLTVILVLFLIVCYVFITKYEYGSELADQSVKIIQLENSTNRALSNVSKEIDLPAIIKDWYPSVVKIQCFLKKTDEKLVSQSGTGFIKEEGGNWYAFTNKHVISDEEGTLPELCAVTLLNNEDPYIVKNDYDRNKIGIYIASSTTDFGYLKIPWLDANIKKSALRKDAF